jgi:hypothetical protein
MLFWPSVRTGPSRTGGSARRWAPSPPKPEPEVRRGPRLDGSTTHRARWVGDTASKVEA